MYCKCIACMQNVCKIIAKCIVLHVCRIAKNSKIVTINSK